MRRKDPITQILIVIFGVAALVCCSAPSGMTVADSVYTPAPTPALTTSHKIVSNDLPWHEVWRKKIGPSYSKGVSRSFPLVACNDSAVVMPVWGAPEIRLAVLNTRDGGTIWSRQLSVPKSLIPKDLSAGQLDRESPSRVDSVAVDSERVYIALPNAIESFDLRNSQEIWISYDELFSHTGYYIFPLDESQLLRIYGISATQARVYNIDKQDGKIRSIQNYTTEILQDTADGKYLSTQNGLVRVNEHMDQVLWSVSMPGPVRKWLTLTPSGVMLASSGTLLGSLFGIDPESGKVLWQTPEHVASSYTAIKDTVYSLDENAKLIARNVVTGNEIGQMVFDGTPLDVQHASEYWVVGGECGLLLYFGDTYELIALKYK